MGNYRTGTSNYRGGVKTFFSKQSSDLTVNNSTTYVDTDLKTPTLTIGKSYFVNGYFITNSGTTPDFKTKIVITSMVATNSQFYTTTGALNVPSVPLATEAIGSGAGADQLMSFHCSIINVTTAGTFKLQFSQNTQDVSDTIFKKGSFWIIQEI